MIRLLRNVDLGYKTQTKPMPIGFEFVIKDLSAQKNIAKMFSGHSRVESLSDVKFVSDDTFVTGNRDQKMLYLCKLDYFQKQCTILDRMYLKFGGTEPLNVTLICVDNMRLYLTTISEKVGVVDIVNNTFVKHGVLSVSNNLYYHGMTIDRSSPNIVYYSSSMGTKGLAILNKTTNTTTVVKFPGLEDVCLKQTRVLGDYLVMSGTMGNISDTNLYHTYDGYVGVYKKDTLECVDLLHLKDSQMDDLVVYDDRIFFVRQGVEDYGQVFQYEIQDGKLVKIKEYHVGQFPHGLDVRNDIIACTSMKNSSIYFFPA